MRAPRLGSTESKLGYACAYAVPLIRKQRFATLIEKPI